MTKRGRGGNRRDEWNVGVGVRGRRRGERMFKKWRSGEERNKRIIGRGKRVRKGERDEGRGVGEKG